MVTLCVYHHVRYTSPHKRQMLPCLGSDATDVLPFLVITQCNRHTNGQTCRRTHKRTSGYSTPLCTSPNCPSPILSSSSTSSSLNDLPSTGLPGSAPLHSPAHLLCVYTYWGRRNPAHRTTQCSHTATHVWLGCTAGFLFHTRASKE